MHAWQEPFERVAELAAMKNVALTTPEMGERVDLNAPHADQTQLDAAWYGTVSPARKPPPILHPASCRGRDQPHDCSTDVPGACHAGPVAHAHGPCRAQGRSLGPARPAGMQVRGLDSP
ncbi:hypothetical protein G6F22_020483 [Rhizopus arrhizus]|nr:hypothetical protein G6F22_020483 [Rhizopus arrhizus]